MEGGYGNYFKKIEIHVEFVVGVQLPNKLVFM